MTRFALTAAAIAIAFLAAAPPGWAAWTWPLRGEVITPYRNGTDPYAGGQHRGIDVAGAVGTPVVAATAGEVRFAGTAGSSGITVSLRTDDGRYDTSYLHLAAIAVRKGDRVRAGDRLGTVGTTGVRSAEAPHLHFGVRDAGSDHAYHDPLAFLPPAATTGRPQEPPTPVAPEAPAPVAAPAPAPAPVAGPRPLPSPARRHVRRPQPATRLARPRPVRRPAAAPHGAPVGAPVPRRGPASRHAPAGGLRRDTFARSPVPAAGASGPAGAFDRGPVANGLRGGVPLGASADAIEPRSERGADPSRRRTTGRGPGSPSGAGKARGGAGSADGAGKAHGHAVAAHGSGDPSRAAGPPPGATSASIDGAASSGGPDAGWALACLGLLIAAALVGTSKGGREVVGRRGGAVGRALRPLLGRR